MARAVFASAGNNDSIDSSATEDDGRIGRVLGFLDKVPAV
jgi:hypothetical protein